jgi:hypothetical protein
VPRADAKPGVVRDRGRRVIFHHAGSTEPLPMAKRSIRSSGPKA